MTVIKRYPNRKLYDTEAKQYITLEGIANLIREGQEVHVVDNATGEDLTTMTLTQIILEQEKKQSGFLPRSVLAGLIQAGGDRLNALQRSLASSVNLWRQIDEEIRRRVQTLISEGELSEGEGRNILDKLLSQRLRPHDEPALVEGDLERILAERQVPTRADLQRLLQELDSLAGQLDDSNKTGPHTP
ncbi:MAG TPA: polyhydroxyalkanoate synthesis regulator DNA-binding domain-containing protein [Anaerolineales bacterium]